MGWFDYLMLLVLVHAVYEGWKKGFVLLAAEVISLFLGYWAAVRFSANFVDWVAQAGVSPRYVWWITCILVFIAVVILSRWAAVLVSRFIKLALLDGLNKLLGILASFLRTALLISIVIQISVAVHAAFSPIPPISSDQSVSFPFVKSLSPAASPHFEKWKNNA